MLDTLHFELVSPERLLMEIEASSVVVPGSEGDFMVLPKHAPLMSTIRPGVVTVKEAENDEAIDLFIRSGFADVTPKGLVILAEEALFVKDLSKDGLEQKVHNAKEDIQDAKSDEGLQKAQAELHQLEELLSALR